MKFEKYLILTYFFFGVLLMLYAVRIDIEHKKQIEIIEIQKLKQCKTN